MPWTTDSWALHSIAGAYALALAPHLYFNVKLQQATKFKASNISPRGNLDAWKSTLPKETVDLLTRARGAHFNGLEGFPLFAAAMIAGTIANLPSSTLNSIAGQYLISRVAFIFLYLRAQKEVTSFMRTAAYIWGIALSVHTLIKAGNAMMGR